MITYINFKANNLTVEIDNEINVIHKYIRDKYSKRFPELESLVPNALDYIRTVKELGNRVENAKNNEAEGESEQRRQRKSAYRVF